MARRTTAPHTAHCPPRHQPFPASSVGWILVAFFVYLSRTAFLGHIFWCNLDILECRPRTYLFAQALDENLGFSNDSDGPARQVPSCDILVAPAARPGHRGGIFSLFSLPITSPSLPYPW